MITFDSVSNIEIGNPSINISYPSGTASGKLLVICVGTKPNDWTSIPSGFTSHPFAGGATGGAGTATRALIMTRIADGSESGTVTFSTSGQSVIGGMLCFNNLPGALDYQGTWGADATTDTNWSATSVDSVVLAVDDLVIDCSVTDNGTTIASGTLSGPATFGAASNRANHFAGGVLALTVNYRYVTSGSGTGSVTYTRNPTSGSCSGVTAFLAPILPVATGAPSWPRQLYIPHAAGSRRR
jgi:hypothetical protein